MEKSTVIIIMAKQPRVGMTKTRLCPPFTPKEAADLYEALLRDSISLAASIPGVDLAIAISPPDSNPYFESIAPPRSLLLPIEGTDIGDCLVQALGQLLHKGYQKAIALNSDGPSLPSGYIQQAINALDLHDLVFGQAQDGGYYLVGMKQLVAFIFMGISWSTNQVLAQTLARAREKELRVALTPQWYDVDTVEDVVHLIKDLNDLPVEKMMHTRQLLTTLNLKGLPG